jgi:hypothetical protein
VSNLYLPPSVTSLKDQKLPQLRVGIQGPAGSGKTVSAKTFPNPVFLNFDRGLTQFVGQDLNEVKFWDEDFVAKELKCGPSKPGARANRKDALTKWLREHGLKMTEDQTQVWDSWTTIQDAFDEEQALHPKITKEGKPDEFDFWAKKIDYSNELMTLMCSMKCNVVVTFHEVKVRDPKTGVLMDKIEPLMQGKFVAKLKLYFTDFFRMLTEETKNTKGQVTGCEYFWQVKSDNKFDAKSRLQFPADTFLVEPNYSIFTKYGYKGPVV